MTDQRLAPSPIEGTALTGQVARLFFERQLTKVEIAAHLGISRFRVARLIDRAIADGVVRIEFRDMPGRDRALARRVEERFGLDLCVVAAADAHSANATAWLAADVLDGLLDTSSVIGIAWGSTIAGVVGAMRARDDPSIEVVQLAGSSTMLDAGTDPGDLTRVLAERLGGRSLRIHAPAFVESTQLRAALVRQSEVAATVARFDHLSIALLGIGAFDAAAGSGGVPSSSLLRSGALGPADIRTLLAQGTVGDLLVHPFDPAGAFVAPEIAARSVAISVDQLRRVPHVIAVAGGYDKLAAIRGALASGIIGTLVTDAEVAAGLVGMP